MGDEDFSGIGIFIPETGIFENLEFFIPEIRFLWAGLFFNLGIFLQAIEDFINMVILAWGMAHAAWDFKKSGDFYPGDMRFLKIWEFLMRAIGYKKTCNFYPGDLGLRKFWNFHPRQRIFENLEPKRHLSSTVLIRFSAVNCETHLRQKCREFFIENHRFWNFFLANLDSAFIWKL